MDLSEVLRRAAERRGSTGSVKLVGEAAARALDCLAEADLKQRLAEEAAAAAQQGGEAVVPTDLRRSTLDAAGKSRYIREFGIERYQKLKP